MPANAPLPYRSVCPPDLNLRQVPSALEGRGHQNRVELQSWLGLAPVAPRRCPWPDIWVSARSACGGWRDDVDERPRRCRVGDRGMPAGPRCTSPRTAPGKCRNRCAGKTPISCAKTFFFEGADEPLLHGRCCHAGQLRRTGRERRVVAPFEVVLAELAALIADGVLRRASSTPGRLVKYKTDLGARGSPLENSKAERASRPVATTTATTSRRARIG